MTEPTEKNKLDQVLDWFKNQWLVVGVLVLVIIYLGIAKIIKATKDIQELPAILQNPVETPKEPSTELASTKPINQTDLVISGKIMDGQDRPLKNAKVSVVEWIGQLDRSDSEGNFILHSPAIPIATHLELEVSMESFEPYSRKLTISDQQSELVLGKIILQNSEKKETPVSGKTHKISPPQSNTPPTTKVDLKIEGGEVQGDMIIGNQNVTIHNYGKEDSLKSKK